jgi:hypothetical protein
MQPMPALFRIVNDDHPPFSQGASPVCLFWFLRDNPRMFKQLSCRDSKVGIFLETLHEKVFHGLDKVKHPWIVNARRTESVIPKKSTEYEEAVKSVQEWNAFLPRLEGWDLFGNIA